MVNQYRFYRIITLAAFSLLVLAPLTAEAGGGSSLAALCSKIHCWPVLGPVPPKIAHVLQSEITPGGYVTIQGSGFGDVEGELWLTGLWEHPVGESLATAKSVKLTIPKGGGGWDFWTPTQVLGLVPDSITRVKDQPVKLRIKTATNQWSNEYPPPGARPLNFVARRDKEFIPSSDPAVQVASCSDDANWNDCRSGPCLLPGTFCGFHENCWACVGDDSGTDTFKITLKNGWVFTSNSPPAIAVSEVGEASASIPSPALRIGPNVWQLGVSWSATPDDWVLYSVGVFITGPIGVPWK